MTPGEEAIYNFIVERNAFHAKEIVKKDVTKTILNAYAEIEMKKLYEFEDELWKMIYEKEDFPLLKRHGRGSLFTDVFNNINCIVNNDFYCPSGWEINPLKGKGVTITYDGFNEKLGVSKDVAKCCIESLIKKGKIFRKRDFGGYQYTVAKQKIIDRMIEAPGGWKPVNFNPDTMSYEEDESMFPIVEEAQKHFGCFQEYYEKCLMKLKDNQCKPTTT